MKKTLVYADIENPIVAAIVNRLYSFKTKNDAEEILVGLRDKFITSKSSPKSEKSSLILWIRNFALSPSEKNFLGNFANIVTEKKADGKWTLHAHKIDIAIKFHPERVYEKAQHPNWGHPLLRGIKKKRIYDSVEEAARDLQSLQEDYPKTSIPAPNKLYLMVYEQAEKGRKGGKVNKYTLEIKSRALEERADVGGFFIDTQLNETIEKTPIAKAEKATSSAGQAQGRFTSMVALRRNKKKPAKSSAQALSELLAKKDK